jgi:excisionase family DNA binding protein
LTDNPFRLLTIGQSAERLGVAPDAVVKIAAAGGVGQVRVGWQVRFKLGDIEALARRRGER